MVDQIAHVPVAEQLAGLDELLPQQRGTMIRSRSAARSSGCW